jgi:hypothetical protein
METILVSYYDPENKLRYFIQFNALWAAQEWITTFGNKLYTDCKIYNAVLTEVKD